MSSGGNTDSTSNKFAVVTGASSGIGCELADQFAQHGFDVVVEDQAIADAADRLSKHGTKVENLRADLANPDGVEPLYSRIRSAGRTLDAIAVNAGVGVSGPFHESDLGAQINLIDLNVLSPVHLTHRVLKDMVAEAIRSELRDSGVTITTMMPGATETNFFKRAGAEDTKLDASEKDDPADVAREGFEALTGKDHVVAGSFKNKVQATVANVLPDTVTAGIHRKQTEPGSANK